MYSTTETCENQGDTVGGYREPIPTLEEVEKALKSLKPGKAAGPDEIPAELLKLGEESVTVALHRIIVITWKTGKWPTDWTLSTFVVYEDYLHNSSHISYVTSMHRQFETSLLLIYCLSAKLVSGSVDPSCVGSQENCVGSVVEEIWAT